jgi:hypothetical protein
MITPSTQLATAVLSTVEFLMMKDTRLERYKEVE